MSFIKRVTPQDGCNNTNYSPFLNLHVHNEGIRTWNSARIKKGDDGGEERGFGLMSWHTHCGLNGQPWQGSITVERAASLLPGAVTQGTGAEENPADCRQRERKVHENKRQLHSIFRSKDSTLIRNSHINTHTHTHPHTHTHMLLSSTYKSSTHTGTRSLYLHTGKFPPTWLAHCILHRGLLDGNLIKS